MNKTIWKFELQTIDTQKIEMPENAKILCVQVQNQIPCIWAMVDPVSPTEYRYFEIFGTGHTIWDTNTKREYIGTYQLQNGALVFHVFESLI